MELGTFLSIAIDWVEYDSFADCLCIVLVLAIFAIARNLFRQSR